MTLHPMEWIYDDGGRAEAGYKGKVGDCATRAIAVAAEMPYRDAYDLLNAASKKERTGTRRRGMSNARTGIHTITFKKVIEGQMGWTWVPKMFIGSGCTTHLRADELPEGRIICNLSRHYAAVIDGVLHDTEDCSRNGMRCVYGYWMEYWNQGMNEEKP